MDIFEIHPEAKKNIDERASSLVSLVKPQPRPPSRKQPKTDIHIAAHITDDDVIGEIEISSVNRKGRIIERFFSFNDSRYGINKEGYPALSGVIALCLKNKVVADKLSSEFIEGALFDWLVGNFKGDKKSNSFIDYLSAEAESSIKRVSVYIPLSLMIVETEFDFCGATIRNVTKEMTDEVLSIESPLEEEEQEAHKIFSNRFRRNYQGYSAVKLEIEAEPKLAKKIAFERAKIIVDLLGIYSGQAQIVDVKSNSILKGSENIESYASITKNDKGKYFIQEQVVKSEQLSTWYISNRDLYLYRKCGLDTISQLFTDENVSEFGEGVLNMAFVYSKAAFTNDPLEKLVYILSALESILLKNENEPIQQNLGERLAIFTADKLEDRKTIIKNLKDAYQIRSKYLHHGKSLNREDVLTTFFKTVWYFYVDLISNVDSFQSKLEFIEAIDDHKLS